MVPCDSLSTIRTVHTTYAAALKTTPIQNSVQKTIYCNSTSNTPDDGRMYPKHVELRIHQQNYLVATSWHFTLFHEEDARSNSPQVHIYKGILKGQSFTGIITTSSLTKYVYNNLIHVLPLQYIIGYDPCNKLTFCTCYHSS